MASKIVTRSIFLLLCGKSCAYFNFHDYFQAKFAKKKNQYRVRCSRVQNKNNIAVLIYEWNEWRVKSRGWDDNRRALLQYILTCEQEARTSAVHLWAYCTHPTRDVNDVMCEGWPQHRGLRRLLFSNSGVGSFTFHKNQISVSAVRRDLRFFVLIRED